MTITSSVLRQFYRTPDADADELIRIPPTVIMTHNLPRNLHQTPVIKTKRRLNIWTVEEHERFLLGLEQFPKGPWKAIASVVGTKTTRQTMTHAQKYREKIKRMSARNEIENAVLCGSPLNESTSSTSSPANESSTSDDESHASFVLEDWPLMVDSEIDSILQDLDLSVFEL